jgi:SAM-dependent methyltransferase
MVGHGDFKKIGEEFLVYFKQFGLRPEHSVLDIGCGIGRMAIPLTRFLTGHYEGFDIVRSEIEWCTKNITPRYPNFQFQVADIFNSGYNPHGKVSGINTVSRTQIALLILSF